MQRVEWKYGKLAAGGSTLGEREIEEESKELVPMILSNGRHYQFWSCKQKLMAVVC